jgi:hypothetical protein
MAAASVFVTSRDVAGVGPAIFTTPDSGDVNKWAIAAASSNKLIQGQI